MSHLDEWALLIAKQLKSEAELVASQAKSELYEDVAREAFIRIVLESFLPGSYKIGSGRVIDATGTISSPQDIVIYRDDYPQFNMPGSHHVFLYESVLATIQISAKLVQKSLFKALDQCASLGELNPVIEPETLRTLAAKMNMKLNDHQQYVHQEPLNTDRFQLIGRPQSFIYGFTGYQTSVKQMAENLNKWIDQYQQHHVLQLKSMPSVIATQGCFAGRNTAPFTMNLPALMGVGNDLAPLRLIIAQLMYSLNRRLHNTRDGYGIRSTISPYLDQFERPVISQALGKPLQPDEQKSGSRGKAETRPTASNEPGRKQPPMQTVQASSDQTLEKKSVSASKPGKTAVTPMHTATDAMTAKNSDADIQSMDPAKNKSNDSSFDKETEKSAPVIEDRSKPRLRPASQATDSDEPAKAVNRPSSPLSLFAEEEDSDVDEYEFQPIEPPRSHPEEEVGKDIQEPVDIDFESTQKIDLNPMNQQNNEHSGESIKAEPVADSKVEAEAQDEAVHQEFLDTLVETSEELTQDKSKASADKKPGYVKEMLI